MITSMLERGVAVAIIAGSDRRADYEQIVGVRTDDRRGEYELTAHLVALGHRRIGFITGPTDQVTLERLTGYRDALSEAGVALDPSLIVPGDFDLHTGQVGAAALLRSPAPPTAIIARDDYVAIGVLSTAKRLGLRVPEDVAVAGHDDIELAVHVDPPLTTIAQPLYEMGAYAMQAILDRIADPHLAGEVKTFNSPLIVRRSTLATAADERPAPFIDALANRALVESLLSSLDGQSAMMGRGGG